MLGRDLRQLLYPTSAEAEKAAAQALQQTALAQPILFSVEYAVFKLWERWGLRPAALIGHSLGEYVCACAAGVIDLAAALELVSERGRLMQSASPGAMLAVPLGAACAAASSARDDRDRRHQRAGELRRRRAAACRGRVRRASASGRNRTAGAQRFARVPLRRDGTDPGGLRCRRAPPQLRPPAIPYVSNLSGDWISDGEATDPEYYVRHARGPVRFADGLACVLRDHPDAILVEVGPGQALTHAARRCAPGATVLPSLPSLRSGMRDEEILFATVGRLWTRGMDIDWTAFAEPGRRRVGLPGYPFQRQRHWIEPAEPAADAPHVSPARTPSIASRPATVSERCAYMLGWEQRASPPSPRLDGHWLRAFGWLERCRPGAGAARCRMSRQPRHVCIALGDVRPRPSMRCGRRSAMIIGRCSTRCRSRQTHIVWLWSHGAAADWQAEDYCYALHALLQALDGVAAPPRLTIVANGVAAVSDEERMLLVPERGSLPGFVATAAQEFPALSIRLVDAAGTVLANRPTPPRVLALCCEHGRRNVRCHSRPKVLAADVRKAKFPRRSGIEVAAERGLSDHRRVGGIGLTLAEDLAATLQASLVLFGRTELPPEAEWRSFAADPGCAVGIARDACGG